jgi:hypothetical protein
MLFFWTAARVLKAEGGNARHASAAGRAGRAFGGG